MCKQVKPGKQKRAVNFFILTSFAMITRCYKTENFSIEVGLIKFRHLGLMTINKLGLMTLKKLGLMTLVLIPLLTACGGKKATDTGNNADPTDLTFPPQILPPKEKQQDQKQDQNAPLPPD